MLMDKPAIKLNFDQKVYLQNFLIRQGNFNNKWQEIKNFSTSYNFLAKSISTSNHMFGRAIWDKLPKCIFENFEIA